MASKKSPAEAGDETDNGDGTKTYSATLVTQGDHRFHTLTMRSDVLAKTCRVDTRDENPIDGFQRQLDEKRADEIAKYIDAGGTIPSSIVLSAQKEAEFAYSRTNRSAKFKLLPTSFLILDGQHRVFGFAKATSSLRVPVVVYNNLTRVEEAKLFIDINTKQRPVPNELLLDIKRLAEAASDEETLYGEVFDLFLRDSDSPLLGLLSPSDKATGKISRVTFYAALRGIRSAIIQSPPERVYALLAVYVQAWVEHLKQNQLSSRLTNPTLFRAIILLFPEVAQKVSDRNGSVFTTQNFRDAMSVFFQRVKPGTLRTPGSSHVKLYDSLSAAFKQQFNIAGF